jgi:hypothetical protein
MASWPEAVPDFCSSDTGSSGCWSSCVATGELLSATTRPC